VAQLLEAADDERLVEFQGDLLRQAALVEAEVGADHDHAPRLVVDALAQQVLPEPALLALDHVGKGLERPAVGAGDGAAPAAVVEQSVHGFLQHALFVAYDDVGRAKFHKALKTVVAVDHAAIKIIEIRSGKTASIQLNHRSQVRWNNRQYRQDHPLWFVTGTPEGFNNFQAAGRLLTFLFAAGISSFLP